MQILPRDLGISIVIMMVILVVLCVGFKKYKLLSWNTVCVLIFTFFMGVIFSLTGISPISGFGVYGIFENINFVPFIGMIKMVQQGIDFYSIANIVGNTLMFAPIGFFAPILYKKYNSLVKVSFVGAGISLLIECSQLFLLRGTDIDDIILNTLGTMVGYGFFKIFQKIMPKLSSKIAKDTKNNSVLIFWLCVALCYVTIVAGGFYDRSIFLSHVLK